MSFRSCCAILIARIWAIISIVFGVIAGTISSAITTLIVFLVALLHLPLNIRKTLSVAATTNDFFSGIQGNLVWRLPVLLLTPIGPLLFVVGVTIISATTGTVWQIGIATGTVYDHDYENAAKSIRSNLNFEKDTEMREFLGICQRVATKDDFALATIRCIKFLLTTAVSLVFGCLAFIPFAVAMALVTVLRLPTNLFKTMKIALATVMLRWDLRIIAVIVLPLIHALLLAVVLIVSMVRSFVWTWVHTQYNLFRDKNPFCKCGQLIDKIKSCYQHHEKSLSELCDPYDHPTGIPMGWSGRKYGLEIERVIRWCCHGEEDERSPGWQLSSSPNPNSAEVYWDRFVRQCIQSTTELLANGVLDYDLVEGIDPSFVQFIPSVAIMRILRDTRQKEGVKKGDIYWKVDDTVCVFVDETASAAKGRASLDHIAALLWPMVVDIQDFLENHFENEQATMATQALFYDNDETGESTKGTKKGLGMASEKDRALNNELRTKIARLVEAILRVRPFQERMNVIFEYPYDNGSTTTLEDLESQASVGTYIEEEEEQAATSISGEETEVVQKTPSIVGSD